MKRNLRCGLSLLAISLALCACGTWENISGAKPTDGRNATVAETPSAAETVRGEDDPPIVTLDLGSALHEHRLSTNDELPGNIIIPTTNLNAVPITAALQAVLAGTDISVSWDTGALGDRLVTVMNLSGPLPKVVDKICGAAKVFCRYHNDSIELAEKETFVVSTPPAIAGKSAASSSSGSSGGMIDAISQLAGNKVQVDETAGNLIYTVDYEGEERVKRYLEQLRNGRPLVVLQLYIWEVTLNKTNGTGINWSQFNIGKFGPGAEKLSLSGASDLTSLANTAGSFSVGAITTGKIATSSVLSFLATQGRVQTISNPQLTFVSGTSASLKVGGKQRYISQVGQFVSATNNTSGNSATSSTSSSSSNSGNASTNTVSTDSIDTGLNVDVNGVYENGIVMASLNIDLTNLVSLGSTASGGGTIDLPTTSDEKIDTVIRVRPGDNLVLAGLVKSSDDRERQGLPLFGDDPLNIYNNDTFQNNELVVIVKPSVVLFTDNSAATEAKKKQDARPLPSALLIDKNGTKPIAVPATGAPSADALPTHTSPTTPVAAALPTPSAVRPELMVAAPEATPTQPIPLQPSSDATPVDRHMMQRGFSHAFDSLLTPEPTANGAQP